eukprot:401003_1
MAVQPNAPSATVDIDAISVETTVKSHINQNKENQWKPSKTAKKTFVGMDKNQEKTENILETPTVSHIDIDQNKENESQQQPYNSLNIATTDTDNINKTAVHSRKTVADDVGKQPNTHPLEIKKNKSYNEKKTEQKNPLCNYSHNTQKTVNQSDKTWGMKISCPCCVTIHLNIKILMWSIMMIAIAILIGYLATVFGFGISIKQGISTVYNDVKYAGSKAVLTTINATQEAMSLIESKLNGYHLESHDVVQWQQVWTTIDLDKLDSFSNLIKISCEHDEFDDKLIQWFEAELKVLQSTESLTDGIYEKTFYDNGIGHVRIGILSVRENEEQKNKYKMLLACRQNKFKLSYDNFGWIRGAPPGGLEQFVFEKAKIELAHKIKRESSKNVDGLIKICESNEDCATD